MHRDNTGLCEAMQRRVPLVYLHAVVEARYLAVWPAVRGAAAPCKGDESGGLLEGHSRAGVPGSGARGRLVLG